MSTLSIEDMSKAYLEHSMVIHNFVIKTGNQIKDSLCRVFCNVQYQWRENDDKSWKYYLILLNCMTEMKKCRYIVKLVSLNTGSLTGAGNRWKFICLTGKRMIPLIHIFIKQSPKKTRMNFRLLCFLILKSLLMNYLTLNNMTKIHLALLHRGAITICSISSLTPPLYAQISHSIHSRKEASISHHKLKQSRMTALKRDIIASLERPISSTKSKWQR